LLRGGRLAQLVDDARVKNCKTVLPIKNCYILRPLSNRSEFLCLAWAMAFGKQSCLVAGGVLHQTEWTFLIIGRETTVTSKKMALKTLASGAFG
jgi:hypothetical protein